MNQFPLDLHLGAHRMALRTAMASHGNETHPKPPVHFPSMTEEGGAALVRGRDLPCYEFSLVHTSLRKRPRLTCSGPNCSFHSLCPSPETSLRPQSLMLLTTWYKRHQFLCHHHTGQGSNPLTNGPQDCSTKSIPFTTVSSASFS